MWSRAVTLSEALLDVVVLDVAALGAVHLSGVRWQEGPASPRRLPCHWPTRLSSAVVGWWGGDVVGRIDRRWCPA